MGEIRNSCKILYGKLEGKRSLAICKHIWEDIITMDPK
jgi:hypothetical protein